VQMLTMAPITPALPRRAEARRSPNHTRPAPTRRDASFTLLTHALPRRVETSSGKVAASENAIGHIFSI
jgi:hypothetical protein